MLIGDWATYVYSKSLKSKDIDVIVSFDKLEYLSKHYELNKNERLKKYEARREEVQIDIYLPHYSKIGIPVEDLLKKTLNLDGFVVVEINYLVALKMFTLGERGNSTKGRKDFIDVVSLLKTGSGNLQAIAGVIAKYKLEKALENFRQVLRETHQLPELKLNKQAFSRLKRDW